VIGGINRVRLPRQGRRRFDFRGTVDQDGGISATIDGTLYGGGGTHFPLVKVYPVQVPRADRHHLRCAIEIADSDRQPHIGRTVAVAVIRMVIGIERVCR
jgi:hypothetical protein